jgi:hypothetical protein
VDPDKNFKEAFAKAAKKYGGHHLIPVDERTALGERMRAEHIVLRHGRDPNVLSHYSVPPSIIKEICGEEPQHERRIKIADKKKAALRWAAENVGATVTAQVIAEIGDFSLSTASGLLREHLDVFRPVKRGFYLIVDPAEERARDRANA